MFASAEGVAAFGAFALRRAWRFAEEDDVEGAASAGGFVFTGGAGATPLSCGTGTVAPLPGAALVFGDEVAAGGFGAGAGTADEVVWSVTPGVTGGGAL